MKKEQHELAIELLWAIGHYKNLIELDTHHPNSIYMQVPYLRKKANHKLTIYKMVIKRLDQRYNRILTELTALKSQ